LCLALNPGLEVDATEPPLATDLECRQLSSLSHRVDGLVRQLQEDCDLLDCEDLVRQSLPSVETRCAGRQQIPTNGTILQTAWPGRPDCSCRLDAPDIGGYWRSCRDVNR